MRTVLTTGANSGLGLWTAIELARRGFRSVGSVRSEAKAEVVAKEAAEAGVEVETVLFDITDAERGAEVIDELRPYALVNNAGYLEYQAVEEASDADARAHLETHVIAPMRLARLCLPHMREQGGGRIVQVSSLAGRQTFPLMGWYQAGKHALEAVSDALRVEVASSGIQVIIVEPGSFKTGITDQLREVAGEPDSRYRGAYERTASQMRFMERFWADPKKAANAIANTVTTRFPRPRYVLGTDARLSVLSEPFLPTTVRDVFYRRISGL